MSVCVCGRTAADVTKKKSFSIAFVEAMATSFNMLSYLWMFILWDDPGIFIEAFNLMTTTPFCVKDLFTEFY